MQQRVRVLDANIRQYAVKKKTASEAGPSRLPKRHQAPAPTDISTSAVEPDVPSVLGSKPILLLSALTVLPTVPSEEKAVRGTTEATSMVPPSKEVRAEVGEPEQFEAVPIAPSIGA